MKEEIDKLREYMTSSQPGTQVTNNKFPREYRELVSLVNGFTLRKSDVTVFSAARAGKKEDGIPDDAFYFAYDGMCGDIYILRNNIIVEYDPYDGNVVDTWSTMRGFLTDLLESEKKLG